MNSVLKLFSRTIHICFAMSNDAIYPWWERSPMLSEDKSEFF